MKYCMPISYKTLAISCLFKLAGPSGKISDTDIIINIVSKVTEIHPVIIKSKSKETPVFEARIICMALIQKFNRNYTLKMIGKPFGKGHCTVLNSINKFEEYMSLDRNFRRKYLLIEEKIKRIERDFI